MSEKKVKIEADHGLVIRVPTCKSLKGQYLWFGNKDGRYVGTIRHKTQLKKLRRWIDEIIGSSNDEGINV